MRVFVAGASGAIGRRLIPLLVRAGHVVVGMTRSLGKADTIRAAGAEPVVADALDANAVAAAVRGARPEVVVHQLTAIPPRVDPRAFARDFAPTNRLRSEATRHLVAAARASGARRLVVQSFAGWPYAREGGRVKTEEDPLDPNPPRALRSALQAIRELEAAVLTTGAPEGLVLRYGVFYGPGTSLGAGGSLVADIRRRRIPVVGSGAGVWSFIHVEDAAAATLAAIERGAPGIYNVVDDDPAPVAEWLPVLARVLGARPPRRLPAFLVWLVLGELGITLATRVCGASNAKAKRELGWTPAHASWRDGFHEALPG